MDVAQSRPARTSGEGAGITGADAIEPGAVHLAAAGKENELVRTVPWPP